MNLRFWVVAALVAAGPIGCGDAKDARTSSDDVTSVENTPVKRQAIGNCWLYATAGWAESLHKTATGHDVDISEAYWNYWYWFEQIAGDDVAALRSPTQVITGGEWGVAVELASRYGWMHERDFIPEDDADAQRHRGAQRSIDASLNTGALASPEARRDLALVRRELDAAWRLSPPVVEAMNAEFPPDVLPRTLPSMTQRAGARAMVHAPQELVALSSDGTTTITFADALGTVPEGVWPSRGIRDGEEAWTEQTYEWTAGEPERRRAILKNLQHVLNQRLAVPLVWVVDFDSRHEGAFRGTEVRDRWSMHVSLVVDYAVTNVPGFGELPVGVRELRADALEASLADEAIVKLLRIKNSWGTTPVRDDDRASYLPQQLGYNDLHIEYLDVDRHPDPGNRSHLALKFALPRKLRFPIPEGR
jgi:hypothetical protein